MNGRLRNVNNTGDFTCYKENGASEDDYLICQPSCMHLIKEFSIISERAVSDHCPLSFILYCPVKSRNVTILSGDSPVSYKWGSVKTTNLSTELKK